MRGAGTFVLLAGLLGVLAWPPGTASAARPCPAVALAGGVKAKVATVRTPCGRGRRIARTYFERIRAGDEFDGKAADGRIFFSVRGFRCFTGLGGNQMYCQRHQHRVYGSSLPEDDPSTWRFGGAM
jgi:hypothetical protein